VRELVEPRRYFVRSADGRAIYGFESESTAAAVAREYGPGASVVDTLAQAYVPMLQEVQLADGRPTLVISPVGGWDTGRFGLNRDLIEAVKRGRVAIVHAFLAKGASADARDADRGSALHWAAARGATDVAELLLAHGADVNARDASGLSPLDVAERRGKQAIATVLRERGAN
jgi:hypothetical protein